MVRYVSINLSVATSFWHRPWFWLVTLTKYRHASRFILFLQRAGKTEMCLKLLNTPGDKFVTIQYSGSETNCYCIQNFESYRFFVFVLFCFCFVVVFCFLFCFVLLSLFNLLRTLPSAKIMVVLNLKLNSVLHLLRKIGKLRTEIGLNKNDSQNLSDFDVTIIRSVVLFLYMNTNLITTI